MVKRVSSNLLATLFTAVLLAACGTEPAPELEKEVIETQTLKAKFNAPRLVVDNFGASSGQWSVYRHVRVMADVNGDKKANVVGFSSVGVYTALSDSE